MAQEQANMIVEAWLRGLQGAQAASQFKKEQEFRENELAERRQEHENTLNLESAHFDAQQKAAEKLFELQKSEAESNQAQKELAQVQAFQQTGITPSGAAVQPGLAPAPPYQAPISTFNPQTGQITFPQENKVAPLTLTGAENNQVFFPNTGRTYSAPPLSSSPAVLQAATVARQQEAARIREQQAQQAAEFLRQQQLNAETHQNQKDLENLRNAHELNLEQLKLKNQKDIDATNNAVKLQIAKMAHMSLGGSFGGGTFVTDENGDVTYQPTDTSVIGSLLQRGFQGQLTLEQVKKMYPKAQDFEQISQAADGAGIQFMTDKQKQNFDNLNNLAKVLPDLYNLHKIRNDNWLQLQLPFSPASRDFSSTKDRVEASVPTMIKALTGLTRYNTAEAEKITRGLIPNTNIWTSSASEESKKFNNFVTHDIQDAFREGLGNLPQKQQDLYRTQLNLPDLTNATYAPGVEHPTPKGFTPPKVPMPAQSAPSKVIVFDKVRGQPGTIDSEQVKKHPERYSVLGTPAQQ